MLAFPSCKLSVLGVSTLPIWPHFHHTYWVLISLKWRDITLKVFLLSIFRNFLWIASSQNALLWNQKTQQLFECKLQLLNYVGFLKVWLSKLLCRSCWYLLTSRSYPPPQLRPVRDLSWHVHFVAKSWVCPIPSHRKQWCPNDSEIGAFISQSWAVWSCSVWCWRSFSLYRVTLQIPLNVGAWTKAHQGTGYVASPPAWRCRTVLPSYRLNSFARALRQLVGRAKTKAMEVCFFWKCYVDDDEWTSWIVTITSKDQHLITCSFFHTQVSTSNASTSV